MHDCVDARMVGGRGYAGLHRLTFCKIQSAESPDRGSSSTAEVLYIIQLKGWIMRKKGRGKVLICISFNLARQTARGDIRRGGSGFVLPTTLPAADCSESGRLVDRGFVYPTTLQEVKCFQSKAKAGAGEVKRPTTTCKRRSVLLA